MEPWGLLSRIRSEVVKKVVRADEASFYTEKPDTQKAHYGVVQNQTSITFLATETNRDPNWSESHHFSTFTGAV